MRDFQQRYGHTDDPYVELSLAIIGIAAHDARNAAPAQALEAITWVETTGASWLQALDLIQPEDVCASTFSWKIDLFARQVLRQLQGRPYAIHP